jgi:hypothetical protein
VIVTLFITIFVEGLLVLLFCLGRGKPAGPILLTSILANLITQSLLWLGLTLFFRHYLAALGVAEILIWLLESVILSLIPANRLRLTEALFLSLMMNVTSFGLGWFLPV